MSSDTDDPDFREQVADFLDSLGLEDLTEDYRDENRAGDEALENAFDPLPEALAEVPEVREVHKVNTHRDGGDVLVPVVPVLFEDPGEPRMETVWSITVRILDAVHPIFADEHVRHYDCQFAYANEEESETIYRRITVDPSLVERYRHDGGFGVDDLEVAVEDGDDGDDGVPPVYWQQFDARSMASSGTYAGGGGAAIAAATAASSAGAAASCAGAAASGGAAGGGC